MSLFSLSVPLWSSAVTTFTPTKQIEIILFFREKEREREREREREKWKDWNESARNQPVRFIKRSTGHHARFCKFQINSKKKKFN